MLNQVMEPSELKDSTLLGCLVNDYVEVGIFVGVCSIIPGTIRTEVGTIHISQITYLTPLAPLSTTSFSKVLPALVSYSNAGLHLTATLILDIFLEAPDLGSSAMFYVFSFYIDL
jgi:hypothetical protein